MPGLADGITNLRWVLAHVPFIDTEYLNRLKGLGGGISLVGGWRYISGTAAGNGPPFRLIIDSGIRAGMSSDGMQISPMNPWLGMYYGGHRQERARRSDQRRAAHHAQGDPAALHRGQRLVPERRRQDRHHRGRQLRRPDRAVRRLLRCAQGERRGDQGHLFGADRGQRQGGARRPGRPQAHVLEPRRRASR